MIVKSFILQRILSFCMNSVVVVGLYYGFLTVFSIGPSYLFLFRAWVMEEGTEKKVAATTGFIMGQLIMFISIYYAPLHLALGKPHTITVLYLPYLLIHFVLNNTNKESLNSELTRNSMRNLSIQCVFLNHLIFQLFNHFLLPSSISVRLVNIYMFRCNNKIFFIISSFFGWLIGQIFLLKWIEWVLDWLNSNKFIQLRIQKSILNLRIFLRGRIVLEWRDSMHRIFTISLFVISLYHLGKAPSPILTYKFGKELKKPSIKKAGLELEDEEELEGKEKKEKNEEIERTSKMDEKEQEVFSEENYSERGDDSRKMDEREEIGTNGKENRKDEFHKNGRPFETSYPGWDEENIKLELFEEKMQDKKDKDLFEFNKKAFLTLLFDTKRWNRPLRYIENDWFEDAVRNEMSQYFFHTCQSDGKERISFTYPPSLSIFLEMIKKKISRFTTEKLSHNELYNNWILTNEQKKNNLSNKILKGSEALDKGFIAMNVLEKRIRLCNDEIQDDGIQKIYLPEIYDPLLKGPYRGRIKESFLLPKTPVLPLPETPVKDHISINKIHGLLLTPNYPKFEQKEDLFSIKPLPTEICFFLLNLINQFYEKSTFKLEDQMIILKVLVDAVRIDPKDETIVNGKGSVGIKEISKKVPKWSYRLRDESELAPEEEHFQIHTREGKYVVIYVEENLKDTETYNAEETDNIKETDNAKKIQNSKETKKKKMKKEEEEEDKKEDYVVRYRKRSDFGRELIRGSMRAQRRKTVTWRMFLQLQAHSPLFIDRTARFPYFNFIFNSNLKPPKIFFFIFNKWMWKNKKAEFEISDSTKEKIKEGKKKEEFKIEEDDEATLLARSEAWDLYSLYYGQAIRGVILLIQSFFRKRILFPSLIIAKNVLRMLLFEPPEWSEDFEDLNKEMYIICTHDGTIPEVEGEFPENWITDGLQIKILFPFRLKPWHKDKDAMKKEVQEERYCFLTVFGKEAEVPFGSPRKQPSQFRSIWKQLRKMKKLKRNRFLVLLNERIKFFLTVSKERMKWVIKNIPLIKKKIKELSKKNPTSFFIKKETKIYIYKKRKEEDSEPLTYQKALRLLPRRRIPDHVLIQMRSKLIQIKKIELNAITERLRNRKEKIQKRKKNKKKRSRIPSININGKRLELQTNIWEIFKIFKRIKERLKRKSRRLIERLFIDDFLYVIKYVINALSINVKFFLESMKRIIEDKENREIIRKTKNRMLRLFSTVTDPSSKLFRDVTFLSQAYVFFRLSQTPVINFYKLRSDFQYHGTSLFLKKKIKYYFVGIQGIFNSELRYKTPGDSIMNQWKNWLRSHHQYNLSEIGWSKLVPKKKWRKKIKRHLRKRKRINQHLRKRKKINQHLRKKKKKKTNQDFLRELVQKNTLKKKIYKYDLLSYIYNIYTAKGDYGYKSSLEANKMIFSNYNTHEDKPFDIPKNILLNNYGVKNEILIPDIEKALDRKNLDCRILNSISNREPCFFPKLFILYNMYISKPWVIPIKSLLLDLDLNVNQNVGEKKDKVISSNENESKVGEKSARSKMKGDRKKKKPEYKRPPEVKALLLPLKALRWQWKKGGEESVTEKLIEKIELISLFFKQADPGRLCISCMKSRDLDLRHFRKPKMSELIKTGILIIEPVPVVLSINRGGKLIMYQTVAISLIHKSQNPIYQRYPERGYVDKKNSGKSVPRYQKMTENKEKNHSYFCVPENILCSRRRRELRIITCFNSRNRKSMHENTIYDNGNRVKKDCQVFSKNKDLDRDKKKLIKLKFFLWPNYRLEDLACMNRYWFNTNNSIHFSMIRIRMYPQLKN